MADGIIVCSNLEEMLWNDMEQDWREAWAADFLAEWKAQDDFDA